MCLWLKRTPNTYLSVGSLPTNSQELSDNNFKPPL